MFQPAFDVICAECSGQAALGLVYDISRYHRIQASPGLRQAAHYVRDTLTAWGLHAELLTFASNYGVAHWGEMMWPEWDARAGTLHLIEPGDSAGKLADYRETPLSLIPRSAPFDGECELVIPKNKGEDAADYEGLDVGGKIVITHGNVMNVHVQAVEKFGAVGILFDGMRSFEPTCPPMTLPDAIQYVSFWWSDQDRRCFGFALSLRRGQWLRELVNKQAAAGKPVRVRAQVDARFYDGSIQDVTACIPGQTAQEIIIVSHLCHPAPFANDNASGVAAALEAARALHCSIASGKLPPPTRTIRFLWMPEMTGMYPYLAMRENELGQIIAGLDLDMVGQDQTQTGSVMLIERPSEALPSFAPDLVERIREEFFGQGGFPLFRHAVTPFSGGSDHYILSDPQVGIPTPLIIQWPDKFYHTTADTIDKVSPESLGRAAAIAALYGYWLATAGPQQAMWLAHEMNTRFKIRVVREAQTAVTQRLSNRASGPHLRRRLDFMLERHGVALDSLTRLGEIKVQPFKAEAQASVEAEWERCREMVGPPPAAPNDVPSEVAALAPRRVWRAQVTVRPYARKLIASDREAFMAFNKKVERPDAILQTIAMYWADGKRTLAQIVDWVELETGRRNAAMLVEFFQWMDKMRLVELSAESQAN